MSIADTYPVFEPDQVLTNKHLNDLFNYLDQQDRLTRCKLLGSGIVCGLEISHTPGTINITKGCGLTSQGYILLFCDHIGENGYKYYMPYARPPFPNHLQLIAQCGPEPDRGNIPFYTPHAENAFRAASGNTIFLLLTQKEFEALEDTTGVIPLSQSGSLDQYAVVLFLEASQLNLKNCDTNDCNDKGSIIDFDVKPLLVHKRLLRSAGGSGPASQLTFQHIELRRYNVPVKNITSADDVLNAFAELLDDGLLQRLANDLAYCFNAYKHLLSGITTNPFGTLADLKNNLQFIIKLHPVLIQYYYDFIYDLIHALYEFRYRLFTVTSECCGDEMQFPFHLTLGEAAVTTNTNIQVAYRQYFIYSPLFDRENEKSAEIRSLLMRLVIMYQNFQITEKAFRENRTGLPQDIKITPSQYGQNFLSERCIPYYYKVVHDDGDAVPEDLYYFWNHSKTRRGNARYNLSYHAAEYNQADTIVHPLFYDIEWNNFFRVEGHIGRNINTALTGVKSIQQTFNLPFEVIALSADYIGALLRGEDPQCLIQDLESDYRVLIAEFICRLHPAFCFIGRIGFTPPQVVLATGASASRAKTAAKEAETVTSVFQVVAEQAYLAVDHPFISALVSEFHAIAFYTKGNTLSRLCSPDANTIGGFYINIIKQNNGKFVNPISANATALLPVLQRHFFEFIDSVESMFQVVMTQELPGLNTTEFKTAYNRYESEVNFINRTMIALIKELGPNRRVDDATLDYLEDLFVNNVRMLLHTCITERLEALRNEYLRRLAQYRLAKNFGYYFKKHGGIEHKAGVPRGGTFILVYHEERRNRFVDVNSLFVNRELSSVLLSQFGELLKDDVQPETQEAKAKMLAVATLYKDPALYLQFKDVMQRYLDDCKDLLPETRTALTAIINQPPDQRRFDIPNGAVIADFYVPYLCCSDCPPIAYILTEEPSITIAREFCRNDKGPYTIEVSPAGGVIKVDNKDLPDVKFVPSAYTVGTHTITYTVNNKSVSVNVEIVSPPKLELTHHPTENYINTVRFIVTTNARTGSLYEWDYGDGKKLSTTDPAQLSHEYAPTQPVQQFTVTLVLTDGPCKVSRQDTVTLNKPVIG